MIDHCNSRRSMRDHGMLTCGVARRALHDAQTLHYKQGYLVHCLFSARRIANSEWAILACVICEFSTAVLLAFTERGECSAAGVCNATELARHGTPLCVPGSNQLRHEQLLSSSAQRSFRHRADDNEAFCYRAISLQYRCSGPNLAWRS